MPSLFISINSFLRSTLHAPLGPLGRLQSEAGRKNARLYLNSSAIFSCKASPLKSCAMILPSLSMMYIRGMAVTL